MESIEQMRKRHETEIEELQRNCKHKKLSDWIDECWAPAHYSGTAVKICNFCGKVMKRKKHRFYRCKIGK